MAVSRRQFIATSGCAAGGALVQSSGAGAAAAAPAALTLACSNYVRFMPIATGDVRPKDLTLVWVRGDRTDMLRRATDDATIDGGESSMAQHVMRLDRGDRSLVAIPVFPLRNFTARDLYTRKGSALTARGAWRPAHRDLQLGGEWRRVVPPPDPASRARHDEDRVGRRGRRRAGRRPPARTGAAVRDRRPRKARR